MLAFEIIDSIIKSLEIPNGLKKEIVLGSVRSVLCIVGGLRTHVILTFYVRNSSIIYTCVIGSSGTTGDLFSPNSLEELLFNIQEYLNTIKVSDRSTNHQ